MTVRERTELLEEQILQPGAALSKHTRGRVRPEPECDLRTCYQRDREDVYKRQDYRLLH